MNTEEYKQAANYWKSKEYKKMPVEQLKTIVEEYLQANSVCALATGCDDYVRCTPLEYYYHEGKFYIFTEGGEKFIGLEKNANVSLAVFEKTAGFQQLKSVQVMGKATIIEPMSEEYVTIAEGKKIPVAALQKLIDQGHPMNLLCVTPTKMDILFSEFKKLGYDSRQELMFE